MKKSKIKLGDLINHLILLQFEFYKRSSEKGNENLLPGISERIASKVLEINNL